MADVVIPMQSRPAFKMNVTLDKKEYGLAFAWNSRGAFWNMMISDAQGEPIVAGIRLNVWYPLKAQHTDSRLPPGEFWVVDPNRSTATIEPGRNDFTSGRNLQLIYRGVL